MRGPASSNIAEIYMQAQEPTAISKVPETANIWRRLFDDVYSLFNRTHLENFFYHINNLDQNIKFTIQEESNGKPAFLGT